MRGQVEVATTEGEIVSVALDPADPTSCPEAVESILEADWVVLGPGSWFSSVIPHLLVPDLRAALEKTAARRLVVLNLEGQQGETQGWSPEDHLGALLAYAPGLRVDRVLADPRTVADADGLRAAVGAVGGELVLAEVAAADGPDGSRRATTTSCSRPPTARSSRGSDSPRGARGLLTAVAGSGPWR